MIRALAFLCVSCMLAGEPITQAPNTGRSVIEGQFQVFTTDELGNVYVVAGDELQVYDKQGRTWLRNSAKTFGQITNIDAFYSLKPMVFSRSMGQLAVLDNTLSLQGGIVDLPRKGFPQVVLACMSVQNSFWFFDERDLALVRTDGQFRTIANTGRLDQQLGFTPKPVGMQELDGWLYVNDPKEGILVFDLFGTYAKTLPLPGARNFQVRGNMLYFFADGTLQVYDMRSFSVMPFPVQPDSAGKVLDVRVEQGRVYMHQPDRIVIQELQRTP